MPRLNFLATTLMWFIGLAILAACSAEDVDESKKPARLEEQTVAEAGAEDGLVITLHDIAEIFETNAKDTAAGIAAVRAYVNTNKAHIKTLATTIDRTALDLSGDARTEYVDRHETEVREAMMRFARAQQTFREAASEAQKVELSEILNILE